MNEDGSKRYGRIGKQFKEVLQWMHEPEKTFGNKLSPVLRESLKQITLHNPGSGFPAEFEKEEFWKSLPLRAKSVGELFLPFSLASYSDDKPGQFLFAIPTSRGMTNYKTVELFKDALEQKDRKKVRRVFIASLENNLNAVALLKRANSVMKTTITYDNKKLAIDLFKDLKSLDPTAKTDAIKNYSERGWLTPGVLKELQKLIKNDRSIATQRKALGLDKKKGER
jgi:hypothetical protein